MKLFLLPNDIYTRLNAEFNDLQLVKRTDSTEADAFISQVGN
jgi:hypothetical protein